MDYLKKHDPITWSELHDDPTHGSIETDGVGCLVFLVTLAVIIGICLFFGL